MVRKAKEYHQTLETLMVGSRASTKLGLIRVFLMMLQAEEPLDVPVSITQLMAQKEKNQMKQRELKEKRAKLKTFQGLPPVCNCLVLGAPVLIWSRIWNWHDTN